MVKPYKFFLVNGSTECFETYQWLIKVCWNSNYKPLKFRCGKDSTWTIFGDDQGSVLFVHFKSFKRLKKKLQAIEIPYEDVFVEYL